MTIWKKWTSVVLAASLILPFGALPSASAEPEPAKNSMEISSNSGDPGDELSVSVSLTPDNLIEAYDISIKYDADALELVQGNEVEGPEPAASEVFQPNFSISGQLSVHAEKLSENAVFSEDQEVFTLNFRIKDDAEPKDYPFTVMTSDLYEGQIKANTTVTDSGKITVNAPAATYTVTFDAQGGSSVDPVTGIAAGGTVTKPTDPTFAGYVFAGWYKKAEGTNEWSFSQDQVTANTTLYAKWTAVPVVNYAVTFDTQGGSEITGLPEIAAGSTITRPADPAKPGYTFEGWYKEETAVHPWDFAADSITADTTLYAQWTRNSANIKIGAISGTPGSTVKVAVTATDSNVGIAAYNLQIDFDPQALEVTDVQGEAGDYFDSFADGEAGWVKAAWVDGDAGDTPIKAGESLFTITFKIKADAQPGKQKLTVKTDELKNFSFVDSSITEMEKNIQPGSVTITEGPMHYDVTFDSQGGSVIDGVTGVQDATILAPTAPVRSGYAFAGWFKDAAGTQAWNFATDTLKADLILYAKWTVVTPNPGGSNNPGSPVNAGGGTSGPVLSPAPAPTPTSPAATQGLQVIVDGVVRDQIATGTTTRENNRVSLTANIDRARLMEQLDQTTSGTNIVIPVTTAVDGVSVVLTGDVVKAMESKQAVLEIRTPNGNYKLPAGQIAIDRISVALGQQVSLADIVVHVDVMKSDASSAARAANAAAQGGYTLVAEPVSFMVSASHNGRTVNVERFNQYVEREIPLKEGIDPSRVTTATVVEADGSIRHVPTVVIERDGKYAAVVKSLTNSDYSLVWNPKTFADVAGHWSQQAVNDMASRMIVKGMDETQYVPNANVTRAEFAAVLVRALGLSENGGSSAFTDVNPGDWYAGVIAKAAEYELVKGDTAATFGPSRTVTRQEALVMIGRAMDLAGLDATVQDTETVLSAFADQSSVATWARTSAAAAVESGIVQGSSAGLRPTDSLTRAETAALVQRFLIQAGLINPFARSQN